MACEWNELPVRVYYEDTDAQGIVYFASYLRFMERGRTEWLRERGLEQQRLLTEEQLCFSLVETSVRFRRPARFDDRLMILTRLSEKGRARVSFEQHVRRTDGAGELLCSADCTAACLDTATLRPRRLPADLLSDGP